MTASGHSHHAGCHGQSSPCSLCPDRDRNAACRDGQQPTLGTVMKRAALTGTRRQPRYTQHVQKASRRKQSLRCSMRNLTAIEIKAFVPAKDFQLAKKFYQDLGFTVSWSSDDLAYICHGNTSFLLQKFPQGIENFMMHLLVQDVDAWWSHIQERDIVAKYG